MAASSFEACLAVGKRAVSRTRRRFCRHHKPMVAPNTVRLKQAFMVRAPYGLLKSMTIRKDHERRGAGDGVEDRGGLRGCLRAVLQKRGHSTFLKSRKTLFE